MSFSLCFHSGNSPLHSAQLQNSYAPELNDKIIGYACGGVPNDIGAVAYHINNTIVSGLIVGVMQGLVSLKVKRRAIFSISKAHCLLSSVPSVPSGKHLPRSSIMVGWSGQ